MPDNPHVGSVPVKVAALDLNLTMHVHRAGFGAATLTIGGFEVTLDQAAVFQLTGALMAACPTSEERHARNVVAETLGIDLLTKGHTA